MKSILHLLKTYAIAGFTFLLPVCVIGIIVLKVYKSLKSTGTKIASIFGYQTFMGMGAVPIITILLIILICLLCGYLMVRYSFMKRVNARIENTMMTYIPGYKTYRKMAEEAIIKKETIIPYTPAFLHAPDGSIKPVFIVEKNEGGNCVVIIPDPAHSPKGPVAIVTGKSITTVDHLTANEFNDNIKAMGKGMLELYQELNRQQKVEPK